jgi:NAD(P)-dependent dehydrogenase (short-subunit alcohol dehydrogenase family)
MVCPTKNKAISMNIDLSGKVALVTASTGGIGYAIAKGLAASGAEVMINGRSERSVSAAIARLQNEVPGAKLRPAIADLSSAEGVNQLVQAVNGVDILVNNAGIYGPQDFYETDDATWENYWQTNVMSECVFLALCYRRWYRTAGVGLCLSLRNRRVTFRRI